MPNKLPEISLNFPNNYAAFVVILVDDPISIHAGKLIMVQKTNHHDPLPKFPGGKNEPEDKSAQKTAAREIMEELSIRIHEEDLVHLTTLHKRLHDVVFFGYQLSHLNDGTVRQNTGESESVLYVDPEDLMSKSMKIVYGHEEPLYALGIRS